MSMIYDILIYVAGSIVIVAMAWGCWESSVMLSERSKLRKMTGAYYDFEIDEALKEMGLTREQALNDTKV
jgi:hypothetical protein